MPARPRSLADSRAHFSPLFASLAATAGGWWRARRERIGQRRALARLDDRLLRDVGLTRAQAEAEMRRLSFWP